MPKRLEPTTVIDLARVPLDPSRWRYVLDLILKQHNWQHAKKHKGRSHKTQHQHKRFCYWLFEFLRHNPEKSFKLDPRSLSGRHIDVVMAHWRRRAQEGSMAPATVALYLSFLRTFMGWIGKAHVMKPSQHYFDNPAHYQRSYCASEDKSFSAKGIDAAELIREVEAYDVHVAASMWLICAFGLRKKESVMLRPHMDVVTAEQARKSDAVAFYLDTHRGTKGGRRRYVPIDTQLRQQVIEHVKPVARKPEHSVSDPALNLEQALNRYSYVMKKFGITRAMLGVTGHGLRHESAASVYQAITGALPPVAGGPQINRALDDAARREVAEQLGHGRVQIVNAYLGRPGPSKGASHLPTRDAVGTNAPGHAA